MIPTTYRHPGQPLKSTLIVFVLLTLLLSACQSPRAASSPILYPTSIPPTQAQIQDTPTQLPAPTVVPPTQTTEPTQAVEISYDQPLQPTATLTEMAAETPTATAEAMMGGKTAAPLNVTITVEDDSFNPKKITVPIGSTVTWIEVGGKPHKVNADNGAFKSGTMSKNQTFSYTFTKAGTFRYYCRFHGASNGFGMAGVIEVTP